MNLEDLIRRFRTLAGDTKAPQFCKDADITDWLNDAQVQACVRGRLLLEDANPAMCIIDIEADRHTYPLHRKLYELVRLDYKAAGESCSTPIKVKSREWLDENQPQWRDIHRATRYAIQGETVHCRIGSSERQVVAVVEHHAVHCRIGSSETWWL